MSCIRCVREANLWVVGRPTHGIATDFSASVLAREHSSSSFDVQASTQMHVEYLFNINLTSLPSNLKKLKQQNTREDNDFFLLFQKSQFLIISMNTKKYNNKYKFLGTGEMFNNRCIYKLFSLLSIALSSCFEI
jgi:hypothetical protein